MGLSHYPLYAVLLLFSLVAWSGAVLKSDEGAVGPELPVPSDDGDIQTTDDGDGSLTSTEEAVSSSSSTTTPLMSDVHQTPSPSLLFSQSMAGVAGIDKGTPLPTSSSSVVAVPSTNIGTHSRTRGASAVSVSGAFLMTCILFVGLGLVICSD